MAVVKANRKKDPLRVGSRVRFPYGTGEVEAVVIEDRGNLGVGGRQIVRVRIIDDPAGPGDSKDNFEEGNFELPAEGLTLIA